MFTALALCSVAARAATLDVAAPAYASPDEKSIVLGTAQPGARIAATAAPSGWMAVELPGPHTVYVTDKDMAKNMEVRPGASYYSAPDAKSPVVGLAGEKDVAEWADNAPNRFNKFALNQPITAYVRVAPAAVAPVAHAAPAAEPAPAASVPFDDNTATLRNDIPANNPVIAGKGLDAGEPRLARTFFGTLASTRNPLRPRRPFDFQLNDSGGNRIAYLDVSRLLQTEQIDAFAGRPVTLFGTAEPLGTGKEIVIRVETLKLQ
ncbi:MAG: hypothetical protein QM765_11430 [Myxococcales bacterium]